MEFGAPLEVVPGGALSALARRAPRAFSSGGFSWSSLLVKFLRYLSEGFSDGGELLMTVAEGIYLG